MQAFESKPTEYAVTYNAPAYELTRRKLQADQDNVIATTARRSLVKDNFNNRTESTITWEYALKQRSTSVSNKTCQ